ncbi:MAG: SEL1-like repeat protein [Alphaproteobacteria bacterium]
MDKSAALVEAAADAGDPEARFALGLFHLLGRGVDRNLPEALKLLRRAAEAGDKQAEIIKGMAAGELAREQIAAREGEETATARKEARRRRKFPKPRIVKTG